MHHKHLVTKRRKRAHSSSLGTIEIISGKEKKACSCHEAIRMQVKETKHQQELQ
jgi:hypothetical protein